MLIARRRGGPGLRDSPIVDDHRFMAIALELAQRCPPSATAYSVGAVVVAADGTVLARGFSRQTDGVVHAEEAALLAVGPADVRLRTATIYSTLEPCSRRASRPRSCSRLIIDAGIARVVIAWREPDLFVADPRGAELLAAAGVCVVELDEYAPAAMAPNSHLPRWGLRQ